MHGVNGLTLLGLIGMAWVAVSVLLGVGIGRCCYDTNEPERSSRETATRRPAGESR